MSGISNQILKALTVMRRLLVSGQIMIPRTMVLVALLATNTLVMISTRRWCLPTAQVSTVLISGVPGSLSLKATNGCAMFLLLCALVIPVFLIPRKCKVKTFSGACLISIPTEGIKRVLGFFVTGKGYAEILTSGPASLFLQATTPLAASIWKQGYPISWNSLQE